MVASESVIACRFVRSAAETPRHTTSAPSAPKVRNSVTKPKTLNPRICSASSSENTAMVPTERISFSRLSEPVRERIDLSSPWRITRIQYVM